MHTIRLRDPWEYETGEEHARWRRWFNQPTGLESGDNVELWIDHLPSEARVIVNRQPLSPVGSEGSVSLFDIAALLALRNEIVVELPTATASEDRPFGEVKLVIL
jgi:hypothetical protein